MRRLFGREGRQEPSDFHPAPRPRDEKGQVQQRTIVHDPAMPDPVVMREQYAPAIALIRHYRPLRASLLDDMLGRIEHALNRFRRLESGEEHRFQSRNEEYRRADTWLDNRVGELRAERETLASQLDAEVAERQEALAQAREIASVARVAAGLPLHFKDIDLEQAEETSVSKAMEATQEALAQTGLKSILPSVTAPLSAFQKMRDLISRSSGGINLAANGMTGTDPVAAVMPAVPAKAFPEAVPFPLEEGVSQALPEAAIAVEQGLPYQSPTARSMGGGQRWLSWVALVACGSIFGISIGLLTQFLNIDMLAFNPARAAGQMLVLAILGMAMFWVLGRVVFAAAAMASEERHSHLLASHRDDTAKVGEWLRRAAVGSLILLPLVGVILIAIEAMVEKYGIVRVFVDGTKNAAFATGHDVVVSSQPPAIATFCLVLMVSVPFVFFHMAEGWVHARDQVIAQYLVGRRQKAGWEIARKCHEERTARTQQQFDEDYQKAKETANALAVAEPSGSLALTIQADVAPSQADTLAEPEGLEAGSGEIATTERPKLEEPQVRMVDVALAMERARECYARVREARARRQEALAWHEARLASYEEERQKERTEPENASKLRLEDAYADYLGSVMDFDKTYRQEMLHVERLMRNGVLVRLWETLFRRLTPG